MFGIVVAIIVTVALMTVGLKINARWLAKMKKGQDIPPVLQKQFQKGKAGISGIGLVLAPVLLALKFYTAAVICLALTLFCTLVFMLLLLFARQPLKLVGTYILVGIGDVTRTLLKITLIGIPVINRVDYVEEVGIEQYMQELARQAERRKEEEKNQKSLSELIEDFSVKTEEEDSAPPQPDVKVWRGEGFGKEYLKVSSDGERYFDPEDGQWHRI